MRAKAPKAQARQYFFIGEWMQDRQLSDAGLAEKLDVSRETVNRWKSYPGRLDPKKMDAVAKALGIEVTDLFRSPFAPHITDIGRNVLDAEERRRIHRKMLRCFQALAGLKEEEQENGIGMLERYASAIKRL